MPEKSRPQVTRRLTVATSLSAAVMLFSLVSPVAGGGETVLATANRPLILGDLAAADNIGVVWQKSDLSFIRWSANDGGSFTAKTPLRGTGLEATDPRLAACGDFLYAASVWRVGGTTEIGIDWVAPAASQSGRFTIDVGYAHDIACLNDVLGVTYLQDDKSRIAILESPCPAPCTPEFQAEIGAAPESGRATIAATDRGFVVSRAIDQIVVNRYVVSGQDETFTVTPKPPTMFTENASSPQIGADGSRVVVAYRRDGQTHMRISMDRGKTFGPRVVVSKFCKDCPEGSSSPLSVDVAGQWILVEVLRAAGIPPGIDERGFLTKNGGADWTKTPLHFGGYQYGVLLDGELAEAWDKHLYADPIYGDVQQEIRFHTLALP